MLEKTRAQERARPEALEQKLAQKSETFLLPKTKVIVKKGQKSVKQWDIIL